MSKSENAKPLLDIQNLSIEYRTMEGTVYALNGVDLHIATGKCLGLVGETGAGKTTIALSLLKLIPEPPGVITGGSVSFAGLDVLNASEKQMQKIRGNKISMIFQDPMTSLNPVIPVISQIEEVIAYHRKLSKADARTQALNILEMVGMRYTLCAVIVEAYNKGLASTSRQRLRLEWFEPVAHIDAWGNAK